MKYTIESSTLEGIADSIREVTKTEASIRPEEMATKIGEISPETLLPDLSNPASAENVQEGYEVIDEEGNVIIGTHVEATLVDLLPNLSNPAVAAQILSGYDAVNDDGEVVTGTMVDNGAVSQTLSAGGSYTIPAGYHNGSGKVTVAASTGYTVKTGTVDTYSKYSDSKTELIFTTGLTNIIGLVCFLDNPYVTSGAGSQNDSVGQSIIAAFSTVSGKAAVLDSQATSSVNHYIVSLTKTLIIDDGYGDGRIGYYVDYSQQSYCKFQGTYTWVAWGT